MPSSEGKHSEHGNNSRSATYTEACIEVHVKPQHVSEFIGATRVNQHATRLEKGNITFDIYQSIHDEAGFVLHEVFETGYAADSHKATSHYRTWMETIEKWMERPRKRHFGSMFLATNGTSYCLI